MSFSVTHNGNLLTSAAELADALQYKLLTQEEARTVYWSQFYVLKEQAANTPPAVD